MSIESSFNTNIKTEQGEWTLCPSQSYEPDFIMNGSPIPSKGVTDLLGDKGLREIEEIFIKIHEARKKILGIASTPLIQYFLLNAKEEGVEEDVEYHYINEFNIAHLFRTKKLLMCASLGLEDAGKFNGRKFEKSKFLRKENWDIPKKEVGWSDFLVYLPEDIIPKEQIKDEHTLGLAYEWLEIANGSRKAINSAFKINK